jgi:hypothetical protein
MIKQRQMSDILPLDFFYFINNSAFGGRSIRQAVFVVSRPVLVTPDGIFYC